MDANERLNDLIELTEDLAGLLLQENKALREKRAGEATSLLERKSELSRIYETRIQSLGNTPEILAKADPERIKTLRELGEKVNLMIEENANLLKITIEATRRVVNMVADAVKAQHPGPATYSANGISTRGDLHSAPQNLAISVNRSY